MGAGEGSNSMGALNLPCLLSCLQDLVHHHCRSALSFIISQWLILRPSMQCIRKRVLLITDDLGSICSPLLPPPHTLHSLSNFQFSSVTQSCLTLRPCARPPCSSPTHTVNANSCPLSRWCHPTISSSVVPFSFCLQCFPASGSFQMSQLFASGGQSIGVSASASVLPMNTIPYDE